MPRRRSAKKRRSRKSKKNSLRKYRAQAPMNKNFLKEEEELRSGVIPYELQGDLTASEYRINQEALDELNSMSVKEKKDRRIISVTPLDTDSNENRDQEEVETTSSVRRENKSKNDKSTFGAIWTRIIKKGSDKPLGFEFEDLVIRLYLIQLDKRRDNHDLCGTPLTFENETISNVVQLRVQELVHPKDCAYIFVRKNEKGEYVYYRPSPSICDGFVSHPSSSSLPVVANVIPLASGFHQPYHTMAIPDTRKTAMGTQIKKQKLNMLQ